MSKTRYVVMQALTRLGGEWNHVEFRLNDSFSERLRQLRTLVPPLNSLNRHRDLVIDKVRVRLPSAIWRCDGAGEAATEVDGSSIIVGADGIFSCAGKDRNTREKFMTCTFAIGRLIDLHVERPDGEVFFLRDGIFANDEPSHSSCGRWAASLAVIGPPATHYPETDFDTIPGSPEQLNHRHSGTALSPSGERVLN